MSEQQIEDNDTGEVVEHSDGQMDYLSERIAEVKEEFEPEVEDTEEEAEPEVESVDEEPEETKADKTLDTFARLLEKEEKQREASEQFSKRQKELESKYSEVESELNKFKEAKENFAADPLSYLKTLGATEGDLDVIAKMIYYQTMGDDAPAEFGQLKDKFQTKQELKQLREELARQDTAKNTAAQEKADEQFREAYVESLFDASDAIPEEFPLVQKFVETYSDAKAVGVMYDYAYQNAVQNPRGAPLTPAECMAKLEEQLVSLTKLNEETAPDVPAKPKKKKRTLRNKQSTIQSPDKDYEGMTDEEVVREARKRANAVLRAGGHIKD